MGREGLHTEDRDTGGRMLESPEYWQRGEVFGMGGRPWKEARTPQTLPTADQDSRPKEVPVFLVHTCSPPCPHNPPESIWATVRGALVRGHRC